MVSQPKEFQAELRTADGRRFLLGRSGWSYVGPHGPATYVCRFPTKRAARTAANRAYKGKGDSIRTIPAEVV